MKLIDGFWFPDDDKHFAQRVPLAKYQREQYDFALGLCKNRRVAIDVGAHVGLFTHRMACSFEWTLAFEPVPENMACLLKNAALATPIASSVVPTQAAVGDRVDRRRMHALPCGWAFMADDPEIPIQPYKTAPLIDVDVTSLDEASAGRADNVDLIKIDVQGAEAAVLRGGARMIVANRPVILIEEKPLGKTNFDTIHAAQALLASFGAHLVKRIGADAIYAFD